jgi:hypothetical protein
VLPRAARRRLVVSRFPARAGPGLRSQAR